MSIYKCSVVPLDRNLLKSWLICCHLKHNFFVESSLKYPVCWFYWAVPAVSALCSVSELKEKRKGKWRSILHSCFSRLPVDTLNPMNKCVKNITQKSFGASGSVLTMRSLMCSWDIDAVYHSQNAWGHFCTNSAKKFTTLKL